MSTTLRRRHRDPLAFRVGRLAAIAVACFCGALIVGREVVPPFLAVVREFGRGLGWWQ